MPTVDTASPGGADPKGLAAASGAIPRASAEPQRSVRKRRWRIYLAALACMLALGGAGGWYWWQQYLNALPAGFAKANGRLEAEQVEIAAKYAGRIATVLAKEGDLVEAGQVLARIDTTETEAQLHSAEAMVRRAEFQKAEAEALIVQRDSERIFAAQELQRTTILVEKGWDTKEKLDQRRNEIKTAQAAYDTAVATRDAAIAFIAAGQSEVVRLNTQIRESTLYAPTRGRIQYKLAQPGEVLSAGGRVLTLLDLSDIYMTIFVPASVAGRLAMGDDARTTLDPVPGYVFPAKVTFVATEAQFTPKTVETAEEREKLMFRVKLSADPDVVLRYLNEAKTGLRGIGYVRTDRNAPWPDRLSVKLP